ncbi:hypothetical protein VNI00_005411 [Paramarasmius palmivorus]|uniref:Uncharacterized protein n=1 Tax=Paramarasmius palmivorus TaxID=297713 RepID=A0AAW0DBP2_9AGAR
MLVSTLRRACHRTAQRTRPRIVSLANHSLNATCSRRYASTSVEEGGSRGEESHDSPLTGDSEDFTEPKSQPSLNPTPARISTFRHIERTPSDHIPFLSITRLSLPSSSSPLNLFPKTSLAQITHNPNGVLYLRRHRVKTQPLYASELRFRVTNDTTMDAFVKGRDYVLPNGRYWGIPLWQIALAKTDRDPHFALKNQLIEDGLVTKDMFSHWETFLPEEMKTVPPRRTIWQLGGAFDVSVFSNSVILWVLGADKVLDLRIGMSFLGYPEKRKQLYEGTARVALHYDVERQCYTLVLRKAPPKNRRLSDKPLSPTQFLRPGWQKDLRCFSYTHPDYLPVLKEILGPK